MTWSWMTWDRRTAPTTCRTFLDHRASRDTARPSEKPANNTTMEDLLAATKETPKVLVMEAHKVSEETGISQHRITRMAQTSKVAQTVRVAQTSKVVQTVRVAHTSKVAQTIRVAQTSKVAQTIRAAQTSKVAQTVRVAPTSKVAPTAWVAQTSKVALTTRAARIRKVQAGRTMRTKDSMARREISMESQAGRMNGRTRIPHFKGGSSRVRQEVSGAVGCPLVREAWGEVALTT